jgi:hypothetical protein
MVLHSIAEVGCERENGCRMWLPRVILLKLPSLAAALLPPYIMQVSNWEDAELLDLLSTRRDVHILIPFRRQAP